MLTFKHPELYFWRILLWSGVLYTLYSGIVFRSVLASLLIVSFELSIIFIEREKN